MPAPFDICNINDGKLSSVNGINVSSIEVPAESRHTFQRIEIPKDPAAMHQNKSNHEIMLFIESGDATVTYTDNDGKHEREIDKHTGVNIPPNQLYTITNKGEKCALIEYGIAKKDATAVDNNNAFFQQVMRFGRPDPSSKIEGGPCGTIYPMVNAQEQSLVYVVLPPKSDTDNSSVTNDFAHQHPKENECPDNACKGRAYEESYYILKGEATLFLQDKDSGIIHRLSLKAGNYVFIPPGTPHQIINEGNTDCEYLANCLPPFIPDCVIPTNKSLVSMYEEQLARMNEDLTATTAPSPMS